MSSCVSSAVQADFNSLYLVVMIGIFRVSIFKVKL